MAALLFEWDEAKNRTNRRKHGVSFEEARTVFLDENARLIADPERSDDESRFVLLGLSIRLRLLGDMSLLSRALGRNAHHFCAASGPLRAPRVR